MKEEEQGGLDVVTGRLQTGKGSWGSQEKPVQAGMKLPFNTSLAQLRSVRRPSPWADGGRNNVVRLVCPGWEEQETEYRGQGKRVKQGRRPRVRWLWFGSRQI